MLRKLAFVVAIVVPALAWSESTATDAKAKQERKEASEATKQQAKEKTDRAGDKTREAGRDMQHSAGMDKKDDHKTAAFEGKHNYDVDGKVAKVEGEKLTIRRDDLPEATLDVSPSTKIELDGDRATLTQLTPGQDVKASFNLQGDKPLAVEVKAKRTDAQKDMKEKREDQQKDMQKAQPKTR